MTTWVKVFNSMPSNPKVASVGPSGGWLFVCGLCYCNEHLTDGFIVRHALPILAPGARGIARLAASLVTAGLWHEVDGGWQVHDYQEHQRSADEVRTLRSWDAERKAFFRDRELVASIRARDGDRCRYCRRSVNWTDRRGECGGTYDHVIPRGGNTYENVVVACKSCNSRKGARTPEQARMRLCDPPNPAPEPSPELDRELDPGANSDLPREEVEREIEKNSLNINAELRSAVVECFAYWQERCNHSGVMLSNDRRAKIEARLKERRNHRGGDLHLATLDLRSAIDGAAVAPYVDERGKRHDGITLICRNNDKLEDFMARASARPAAVVSIRDERRERQLRGLAAMERLANPGGDAA